MNNKCKKILTSCFTIVLGTTAVVSVPLALTSCDIQPFEIGLEVITTENSDKITVVDGVIYIKADLEADTNIFKLNSVNGIIEGTPTIEISKDENKDDTETAKYKYIPATDKDSAYIAKSGATALSTGDYTITVTAKDETQTTSAIAKKSFKVTA